MATRKKLSDETIITTLLTTSSKQECADVLGITPQTISARFHDPEFLKKYNDAQSEVLRSVVVRLSGATDTALDLLIASITDSDIPISLRLQSAKDVLRMQKDYLEVEELARRISVLEDSLEDK